MSAAYIQVHFRLEEIVMKHVDPDQASPHAAVWYWSIEIISC